MLNVILCGTPLFVKEFFKEFLKYKDKYCIKGVITRAAKLSGKKLIRSPIALWAMENNLPLYEFDNINSNEEIVKLLKECDFVLVFAYGKIISKNLLNIPKYGWLNLHPSLLPKLRGASPVQYALLNSIKESALTLMEMDWRMDEGHIIAQRIFKINAFHNLNAVFFELSCWGPSWVISCLDLYFKNRQITKQNHEYATYSSLIKNEDYHIKSEENLDLILRKIKAFGYVFLYYDDLIIKCFVAKKFGKDDLFDIGGVAPIFVQMSGKKLMHIRVFLNGFRKKIQ